jgi:hypothetical protein
MDAERWQRLSPLLDALLELDAERAPSSWSAAREDPALADELEKLLALEDGRRGLPERTAGRRCRPGARPAARIGPYRWTGCSAKAAWARSGWPRAPMACTSAASR